MIVFVAAFMFVQTSAIQWQGGVAIAPAFRGHQYGPVFRVGKAWRIEPHVSFQLEGAFGMVGTTGTHTDCGIGQCFMSDIEFRARELEVPTLLVLSLGPRESVFLTAGPVFAARVTCDGFIGGLKRDSCPLGSDLAWGGAFGVGVRTPIGLSVEARLQSFYTPLVRMSSGDNLLGDHAFRARAVTLAVGWGRR
ncbi:MAG: hypothetical protein ACREMI_06520 [Gemmatimonadales bacterium]